MLYTDAEELGGAEKVLADLVAGLDDRIELTVMGVNDRVVRWVTRGRASAGTCLVPPVSDKRQLRPQYVHWRALRSIDADIFQANLRHPWSCQYGIAAALLVPGLRVIAVEHLPTPPAAGLQRRLKQLTSRRLDAHVAVGHRTAREVERLAGLPGDSVGAIHNGLEPAPSIPRRRASHTVLSLGRLVHQKGFDVLLRALATVPDANAVIAGEGPERQRLEELRDHLSLGDRVALPGWIDDTSRAFREVDALVLPSRFEALPLVVLEAMHTGVPVVASDVGSVAEAIVDGQTGVLVPPDDEQALAAAIRTVLDSSTGARMGERAIRLARERFTRERMIRDYEQLYRELLG